MSNYQYNEEEENSKEAEKIEKFVQTYLIISGLLLTRFQNAAMLFNKTTVTQSTLDKIFFSVDAAFLYFAICILLYYIFVQEKISDFFAGMFALVASMFLSVQIVNAVATRYVIDGGLDLLTKIEFLFIYFVLTVIITYTLIPKHYRKQYKTLSKVAFGFLLMIVSVEIIFGIYVPIRL